jgi:putative transposase
LALIPKSKIPLKKIHDEIIPNNKIELLFYDEAFLRRESTITRGWFPRGHKSQVKCPITKEKVGVCGAVNHRNGRLFSLIFDGFDSDTFIYYLKWLIRNFKTRKKIVLVLDNASSHKSNKVAEFVEIHKKRLELLFLPPYSPELNPVERVWKNLRYRVTHNTFFENLIALENAVIEYLKDHAKPNERLKSLCCIN